MSDMNYYQAPNGNDGGMTPKVKKGCGVAAIICAILAVLLSCIPCVGPILAIIAIIAGIIQVKRGAGKGMGIFGIVLAAIALIGSIVLTIGYVVVIKGLNDLSSDETSLIQIYNALYQSGYYEEDVLFDTFTDTAWMYDDGSVIYYLDDGQFVWYADDSDHSDNYYYGYYSLYQGMDAVNYIGGIEYVPFDENTYLLSDLYHSVLYITEYKVDGVCYDESELSDVLISDVLEETYALNIDDSTTAQNYSDGSYSDAELYLDYADSYCLPIESYDDEYDDGGESTEAPSTAVTVPGGLTEQITDVHVVYINGSFYTLPLSTSDLKESIVGDADTLNDDLAAGFEPGQYEFYNVDYGTDSTIAIVTFENLSDTTVYNYSDLSVTGFYGSWYYDEVGNQLDSDMEVINGVRIGMSEADVRAALGEENIYQEEDERILFMFESDRDGIDWVGIEVVFEDGLVYSIDLEMQFTE